MCVKQNLNRNCLYVIKDYWNFIRKFNLFIIYNAWLVKNFKKKV